MATNFYTSFNLNGNGITGVANPVVASDVATKSYVDAYVQGLDVKASVKFKNLNGTNVTLSGSQDLGSSQTASVDDRVLLTSQTDPTENGIWVVKSGAWVRAEDATVSGANPTLSKGAFTFVEDGVYANNGFVYIGGASNAWTQFSDTGAVGAGNGISISGTTVSVKLKSGSVLGFSGSDLDLTGIVPLANGGLGVNATTAFTTGTTLKYNGSAIVGVTTKLSDNFNVNITASSYTKTVDISSLGSEDVTVFVKDNSGNVVYPEIKCYTETGVQKVDLKFSGTVNATFRYVITA